MAPDDLHRLRTRAALRSVAGMIMAAVTGCTSLGPFEGPQPSADEHALCYSSGATTPDQLHTTARDACSGGEPSFVKQESDLSACPLLVPMRLYFTCGAG